MIITEGRPTGVTVHVSSLGAHDSNLLAKAVNKSALTGVKETPGALVVF